MTLHSMRFDRRKWRSFLDDAGIVHHATRLTKKEATYMFRLASTIRALVPCSACGAQVGASCLRVKDRQPMTNHSLRVEHARQVVRDRIEPRLDYLFQTLCTLVDGELQIVFNRTPDGREVDCMACVAAATLR